MGTVEVTIRDYHNKRLCKDLHTLGYVSIILLFLGNGDITIFIIVNFLTILIISIIIIQFINPNIVI